MSREKTLHLLCMGTQGSGKTLTAQVIALLLHDLGLDTQVFNEYGLPISTEELLARRDELLAALKLAKPCIELRTRELG